MGMAMKFTNLRFTPASGKLIMGHTPSRNHPPVAVNDTTTTIMNNPVTVSVLANDTDVDGDVLTVTSASALHGTVVINSGRTITYTPTASYIGSDSITYAISDGRGGTSSATVSMSVTAPAILPYTGAWSTAYSGIVSNNGRTVDQSSNGHTQYWNAATTSGKIYLEITISRSGSITNAGIPPVYCGWIDANTHDIFASTNQSDAFFYTGRFYSRVKSTSENQIATNPATLTWTTGGILMLARDISTGKFWYGFNGVWSNGVTVAQIAAGLNATFIDTSLTPMPYLFAGNGYNSNAGSCIFAVNNGQAAYTYTRPTGFTPMGSPTTI